MNLFQVVPNNFFSIFSSSNKDIYAEALLRIWREYNRENLIFTKQQCIDIIFEYFYDRLSEFVDEDEATADIQNSKVNKARIIVDNLIKFGWIEQDDELTERERYILIPTYAAKFIKTIEEVTDGDSIHSDNFVTNVYLNIKALAQENNGLEMVELDNALGNTESFNQSLQDMNHNMKKSFNAMIAKTTSYEVLEETFKKFLQSPPSRRYHCLKTEDNLYKFRIQISNIIDKIMNNGEKMDSIVNQMEQKSGDNPPEGYYSNVVNKLNYVKDVFQKVDVVVHQIDRKHSKYLTTALARINYLINRQEDIKGHLATILGNLSRLNEEGALRVIEEKLHLTVFEGLGDSSIYRPRKRKSEFKPAPIKITDSENKSKTSQEILDEKKKQKNESFSLKSIIEFLDKNIQNQESLNTRDIKLNDDTDLIKLILALKYSKAKGFKYKSTSSGIDIINGRYKIPEILFERREDK